MMNKRKYFFPCTIRFMDHLFFVVLPIILITYQSFTDIAGKLTLSNYVTFFTNGTFLKMTLSSFWYAFLITLFALLISYPAAYILSTLKRAQLWLLLIILPTWINLLLKAYAFIGILGRDGMVNSFLGFFGVAPQGMLFTSFAFLFVATYIEIPFMILPIYNSVIELDPALLRASQDLGASKFQTFKKSCVATDAAGYPSRGSGSLHPVTLTLHVN